MVLTHGKADLGAILGGLVTVYNGWAMSNENYELD